MGKKKLAPNGQGGYGQRGTPTTNVSKKTQERMEQMKKKMNSPEYQKQLHQRAISDWLEGERKLNERAKKEKERQKQRQADAKKQMHQILTNWSSYKKQPKLVCNLQANTKK